MNVIKTAILTLMVMGLGGNLAYGCACNKNKLNGGDDTSFAFPPAVNWNGSLDEALKMSKAQNKPLAVYFSSKEESKIIGEGEEVIKEYAAANGNSLPTTVFDLPKVVKQLRDGGVGEVVKIAFTKENRELANKYGATAYTMVILAPDGTRLDGGIIAGGGLAAFSTSSREKLLAWQSQNGGGKVAQ